MSQPDRTVGWATGSRPRWSARGQSTDPVHLLEEPGTLKKAAALARDWLTSRFALSVPAQRHELGLSGDAILDRGVEPGGGVAGDVVLGRAACTRVRPSEG